MHYLHLPLLFISVYAAANDYETISRPALGRWFELGDLYDASKDCGVSGSFLWNKQTLNEKVEKLGPEGEGAGNAITRSFMGSSFSEKTKEFGVSAEVKAGILGGFITLSGGATYLKGKTSSNHVAEVAFDYFKATHTRTIYVNTPVDNQDVLSTLNKATHVITKIDYGAHVIFDCQKEVDTVEDRLNVEAHFKAEIDLGFSTPSGCVSSKFNETEKKELFKVICNYNGDVSLENPPTTFFDAVQAFKSLPGLITQSTTVPITLHLSPIVDIISSIDQPKINRISQTLLTRVFDRFENYDKIHLLLGDLRLSQAYATLELYEQHVDDFDKAVNAHKENFKATIANLIPKIRRGEAEEAELSAALDADSQPYTIAQLKSWVTWRRNEAATLERMLAWKPEIIMNSTDDFNRVLSSDYTYVLALTLQLYPQEDTTVKCLQHNCVPNDRTYPCSSLNCGTNDQSWLKDPKGGNVVLAAFDKFKQMVEHNTNAMFPKTAMVMREHSEDNVKRLKTGQGNRVTVQIFKDREQIHTDFQLPAITNINAHLSNCSGMMVSWDVQTSTAGCLTGEYDIRYGTSSDRSFWLTESRNNGNKNVFVKFYGREVITVAVDAYCTFGVCAHGEKRLSNFNYMNEHNCAIIDTDARILLSGGYADASETSLEYFYPFQPDRSELLDNTVTLAIGRWLHMSSTLSSGNVIIVGGYDSNGNYLDRCELFQPHTNQVSRCPSLVLERESAGVTMLDGTMYVCGGYDAGSSRLDQCEAFGDKQWSKVPWMTIARNDLALVAFDGYLYAIGGDNERDGPSLSTIERWNPGQAEGKWEPFSPSLTTARKAHSAAVINGKIIVCGGFKSEFNLLKSCEQLIGGEWKAFPSMKRARRHFSLVPIGERVLLALGGDDYGIPDDQKYRSAEMFDFDGPQDGWVLLPQRFKNQRQQSSATLVI